MAYGNTMIAAEQLGRKCYMMELDPHYCDVIIARWGETNRTNSNETMIEKVNPCHPDKVADRIAGAIVDLAYSKNDNP